MFETISRNYLVDQVLDQLQERVRNGFYAAGDRLPAEVSLGKEFGVSRSTIREAMRVLAHLGIVRTSRQRRGTFVTEGAAAPRSQSTAMSKTEILDILNFRYTLEIEAAVRAAESSTEEAMARIHSAYDKLLSLDDTATLEDLADADLDFHTSILAASGNKFVENLYVQLRPSLREALLLLIGVNVGREMTIQAISRSVHGLLVTAIEKRDPKAAAAEVRRDRHEAEIRLRMLEDVAV